MGETRKSVELPQCQSYLEFDQYRFECKGRDVPGHEYHRSTTWMRMDGGEDAVPVDLVWSDERDIQ